jgi:hypothetical protein
MKREQRKPSGMERVLRAELGRELQAGVLLTAIARRAGVDHAQVYRFWHSGSLSLNAAGRLAESLGLTLMRAKGGE